MFQCKTRPTHSIPANGSHVAPIPHSTQGSSLLDVDFRVHLGIKKKKKKCKYAYNTKMTHASDLALRRRFT